MHRVFDDWLDMMLYSLQRDDESYLDTIEDYDRESVELYSEAFGELQHGMAETNEELLGVVYEELGQSSDHFGQHFTPHNLCQAMVDLTGVVEDDTVEEPYRIADPASGSGRMLVAAAKQAPQESVFYGQDKDATCAKMTALNLCFFNVDGYAVLGDSLLNERKRVWQTAYSRIGGEIRELSEDEFENPYESDLPDSVEASETGEKTDDPEEVSEEENSGHDGVVEFADTTLSDFAGDEN